MQFWNEHLPNLIRHPGKDIPLPIRPKGSRPKILDIADRIGKYANASRDYDTHGSRLVTMVKNRMQTFQFKASGLEIIERI